MVSLFQTIKGDEYVLYFCFLKYINNGFFQPGPTAVRREEWETVVIMQRSESGVILKVSRNNSQRMDDKRLMKQKNNILQEKIVWW